MEHALGERHMKRSRQRQRILELILDHLIRQGRPSEQAVGLEGVPYGLYRDSRGRSSALGCLMGSAYSPDLEGLPPDDPRIARAINQSLGMKLQASGNDGRFLSDMQSIVDSASRAEHLRWLLHRAAKFWTLDRSRIDEIQDWRT